MDQGVPAGNPSTGGFRVLAVPAAAAAAAVGAPALRTSAATLYLTDAVGGQVGASVDLTLTNAGTGELLIQPNGFTFVGPAADQFRADLSSFGTRLAAGQSTTVRVRMNATRAGVLAATLRIASNDASGADTEVAVRGVGSAAGSKGPTAQEVLDLYGIPVSVGRPAGVGGTVAGEKVMQLLTKAGPGPVTVEPLSVSADGAVVGELLRFGRYAAGATPVTTQLLGVSTTAGSTVSPGRPTAFDPGGATFGLYAEWPNLRDRQSWSQDALNAWETSATAKRKVRFFALKAADGSVVPDAYVVTAESYTATATRSAVLVVRNVREATLPAGWASNEVGTAGAAGYAAAANGTYTVAGGGADVAGAADAFHFAYRQLAGDGEIVARVTQVQSTNAAARAGVMVRESLAANAKNAMIEVMATGGASFHSRATAGGATTFATTAGPKAPYWVRLVRAGATLTGYRSTDGKTWVQQGKATVSMAGTVYVGLAVTAHDNAKLNTAKFDNVSVTPAAASGRGPVVPTAVLADAAAAAGVVTVA
ncbi:MAG: hypothetical protein JWO31_4205, partial [Phycisphaerales bacterium]|nr:hypothetical protein [Phycisphaerales bacterium]